MTSTRRLIDSSSEKPRWVKRRPPRSCMFAFETPTNVGCNLETTPKSRLGKRSFLSSSSASCLPSSRCGYGSATLTLLLRPLHWPMSLCQLVAEASPGHTPNGKGVESPTDPNVSLQHPSREGKSAFHKGGPFKQRLTRFSSPKAPVCYQCGQEGHIRPKCPNNPDNQANICTVPRDSFPKKHKALHCYTVVLNGQAVSALVDTGSMP